MTPRLRDSKTGPQSSENCGKGGIGNGEKTPLVLIVMWVMSETSLHCDRGLERPHFRMADHVSKGNAEDGAAGMSDDPTFPFILKSNGWRPESRI